MNVDVNCALCNRPLEAGMDKGKIIVRPCPHCQRERVVRVFRDIERPDDAQRYALKNTPARGFYVGRDDGGRFVLSSAYNKLAKYVAALRVDYNNVLSSPCAQFRRCRLCGVMTTDGWVCTHCGEDDTDG